MSTYTITFSVCSRCKAKAEQSGTHEDPPFDWSTVEVRVFGDPDKTPSGTKWASISYQTLCPSCTNNVRARILRRSEAELAEAAR